MDRDEFSHVPGVQDAARENKEPEKIFTVFEKLRIKGGKLFFGISLSFSRTQHIRNLPDRDVLTYLRKMCIPI